ncbi:MAG TPA: succinate--CoA ligase subunit alpha [Candidatus Dormibacteraeota bacterium]|nr:succinate--CoA ligase subunit alpha [Candidatus Dormibacteraeota bacterium]
MSVLVSAGSRVLIQGMTGKEGSFHTEQMRAFGTNVVAGVSPGKGGSDQNGVPIFDTVADAVAATGADVAGVFVPPAFAADAIMEAAASAVPLTVCITEGIPIHDTTRARAAVERAGTSLLGPNCPGIVTPAQCKVGIIPNHINRPGPVGIVGRSGTLTYEVIQSLGEAGHGQSTSVGIGGDPVLGLSFTEVLRLFAEDSQTQCVVMIGEIGGSDEEQAAAWIAETGFDKPVVAFISGRTAPPGKRMGHAGAIISGSKGTAQSKIDALLAAGAKIADTMEDVVRLVSGALAG